MKQRLIKLLQNPNIWRAGIIYGVSLLIGAIGFFVFRGDVGWYFITCSPGFGTGVALALLNNGHKKPVTWKSAGLTVLMTLVLAVVMYLLDAPLFSLVVGWLCSVAGGIIGLWFCRWENKREVKTHERND